MSVTKDFEATVDGLIASRPVVGLAVGIVRKGGLEAFVGRGVADLDSHRPITEDTVFRIASITKTFTAMAIMQLCEQRLIDLDAPANDYLRSYKLVSADPGFGPATVRHLLTHTAGLPELAHRNGVIQRDFGESFPIGGPMPSLAEFYGGSLRIQAEPGTRFVYNNHGPATLGQIIEDVSRQTLEAYFEEHIFAPLGMSSTSLLRTEAVESGLATGYEIGSNGTKQVAERDMVTAGAASIYSTTRDMARYVAALLDGGRGEQGAGVLSPDLLAAMFSPHWQPDRRIAGMGLGFFRASYNGHRVVRHQGTHPGFHSEMVLAPDDGVGVVAFTNGSKQADFWLPPAAGKILRRAMGSEADCRQMHIPASPETWKDIIGWYRLDAGAADVRLRGLMGFGVEVFERGRKLMFRFLTPIPALARGFELERDDPNDPFVFRIDLGEEGMDPIRIIVGSRDSGTPALYLDLMPLCLEKQPDSSNPRRWATRAATVLGAAATIVVARRISRGDK